jgi:hypothetical protein
LRNRALSNQCVGARRKNHARTPPNTHARHWGNWIHNLHRAPAELHALVLVHHVVVIQMRQPLERVHLSNARKKNKNRQGEMR